MRSELAALSPRLRTFRDERGRELLDLPGAPMPDPDTPAPPRFLPEYDNLVLSHADRARVLPEEYRPLVIRSAGRVLATFLVDGFVAGTWRIERTRQGATLLLEPFGPLPRGTRDDLRAEGERLIRFAEGDAATFHIRFTG